MDGILPSHSGIYESIKEIYGRQTMQAVRLYYKMACTVAREKQNIVRCCRYGVIPLSLRVKPLVAGQEGVRIAEQCRRCFLAAWVKNNYRREKGAITAEGTNLSASTVIGNIAAE